MTIPPQSQIKPLDIHDIQYRYPKKLANHLITAFFLIRSFNKTCKSVYFSQTYIGKKLKLSRPYACLIVKILQEDGHIGMYYRQSKTSEYEINPYYLEEEQEFKLNRFYKQFFAFSVSLMLSISAAHAGLTQLSLEDIAWDKKTIQADPEYYRQLTLPMAVWLHYGKEKYQSAGASNWTKTKSLAPERTAPGGTPLSLEQQHLNWNDEAYRLFEAQFVTEMP